MIELELILKSFNLEDFPGWAMCEFKELDGNTVRISEKLPVLGLDFPENPEIVNFSFALNCTIISKGANYYQIELPYFIHSEDNRSRFYIGSRNN